MNSTQVLKLIAKNNYLIRIDPNQGLIKVVTQDDKELFELSRPDFKYFSDASYIVDDQRDNPDGRIFYRLTKDGKAQV